MLACRTHNSAQQRSAHERRAALLASLLFGLAASLTGPAFGEQGQSTPHLEFQQSDVAASSSSAAVVGAVPEHWDALASSELDSIRGRFVPATELDLNAPWSVILWNERGGHTGSGNGSGSHQTQHGSNQQRQSLSTTTAR